MKKNKDIDPSRAEKFMKEDKAFEEKSEKAKARRTAGKETRRGKHSKMGVMSAGTVAIVVVVVVLLNILVGNLPTNITEIDLTGNRLYEVSDVSKDYLAGLKYNIDITIIAEEGNIDERITKLLDNYISYSDHLTLSTVDPVKDPTILDKYEDVTTNALVVRCEETDKYTIVPFMGTEDSLIIYAYDSTAQTYVESAFDAEGQVTSAIDYCISDASETVYTISGHGESDFHAGLTDLLGKSNVAVDTVNLLTTGSIPDDCSMLICYSPTEDLANDELKMIDNYMQAGGKVMLFIDQTDLTNFNTLLTEYGLQINDGYVAETTNGKYYDSYFNVFAEVDAENISVPAKDSGDYLVLMAYARGLSKIDPQRSTINVDSFLYSSTEGHLVTENETIDGSYILAATSTETDDSGNVLGKLTVYSSPRIISSDVIDDFANLDNQDIVLESIICDFDGVSSINIPVKDLTFGYNTIANYGFLSILFVALIPLILVVGGLIVWLKRRKL